MPEHGFYAPSRGYWQTLSDVPPHILEAYPVGTVEVGLPPSADYVYDGTAWVEVLPDPAAVLADKRANATIKRGPFLRAIKALGVIDTATARTAASGAWPAAFDAFTAGLSEDDQIDAIATWADGDDIRRMNPVLLQIQAFVNADPNLPDVTDEQLDAAFGIV